ncbi:MAG: outer membrane protein transport protein [Rhizobiaceae bacterium]
MRKSHIASLLLAGCASAAVGAAHAGGFDRGGVNIDLLFDPNKVASEAAVTYVSPQRTIKNVVRSDAPPYPVNLSSSSIDVDGDYWVPRFGVKVNVIDPVDCLGTYSEPYGADTYHGKNNAYSPTSVEFKVDTRDFGLTCSYKLDMGKGSARLIGGVSYQEVEAYLSRQTLLAFGNQGTGNFDLKDGAWGWRLGASYEIPEVAFRTSLVYSSRYKLKLTGTVDQTSFGNWLGTGPFSGVPIFHGIDEGAWASTEIPQAVEFKIQSGIAEGWLAFASVKWQDWSKMQIIRVNGVTSPIYANPMTGETKPASVSLDALYRDGWTVTGGVGHKFNDSLSGLVALTWDRGTSTTVGTQTDAWTLGVGGSYSPNKNVELRLGGLIGLWTSGSSGPDGIDNATKVSYTFDDDLILGGQASLKVKF